MTVETQTLTHDLVEWRFGAGALRASVWCLVETRRGFTRQRTVLVPNVLDAEEPRGQCSGCQRVDPVPARVGGGVMAVRWGLCARCGCAYQVLDAKSRTCVACWRYGADSVPLCAVCHTPSLESPCYLCRERLEVV